MLKVLLKKQFLELGKSYFRSRKTGKNMSKLQMLGLSLLLLYAYFACMFVFAATANIMVDILVSENLDWLYFALYSITTIFVSSFIVIFYAKSILYNAKDNELLLSMPIKSKDIILSRLAVLYFNALIYTSIVWFPISFLYLKYVDYSIKAILSILMVWMIIAVVTSIISSLFGYLVEKFSRKYKSSLVDTATTILFLLAFYYVFFNLSQYANSIMANIVTVESFVANKLSIFVLFGYASIGRLKDLFILIILAFVLIYICVFLLNKNFIQVIQNSNRTNKAKTNKISLKQSDIKSTLIKRELYHFLSNSTYTLNCGLGILVLVVSTICLFVFKNNLLAYVSELRTVMDIDSLLPVFILAGVTGVVGMDAMSTPSISLEGNTYWIIRSLPISSYEVLSAKRNLQIKLNIIPAIIFTVAVSIMLNFSNSIQVLLLISVITSSILLANFDLFLGIKGANLNWISEIVPIKQSFNVMIAVFSSMFLTVLIAGGYYLLSNVLSLELFFIIIILICTISIKMIDLWIRKKGVVEFENL